MRILMWNIQVFTDARIVAAANNDPVLAALNAASTQANLSFILSTVNQSDPDIFVIIEARASQGSAQTLASGGGPNGLLALLAQLKNQNSPNWFLVPPLRLNPRDLLATATYTETIGVFWRNDRVTFTGPYVWPAANAAQGPPVAPGAATAPYPANWAAAVPAGTTTAARCRFFDPAGGGEINFPDEFNRRPFLTQFTEIVGGRTLKLFSVHPQPTKARGGVIGMSQIDRGDWMPGANQITVFAGDFNLNLRNMAALDNDALGQLTSNTWNGIGRLQISGGLPSTRYWPREHPQRVAATPAQYLENELFDFATVRYGAGAMPAVRPPMLVAERVAGVAPGGGLPALTSDMATPLATIAATQATIPAVLGIFRLNGVTCVGTTQPHGFQVGDNVQVGGVTDPSFNGMFVVTGVPSGMQFTYDQGGLPNTGAGNGTVTSADLVGRLFRDLPNFGHIGVPAQGVGTSDHLPIFFIV